MKFVLNKCFGGPSLSSAAMEILGRSEQWFADNDEEVIQLIEEHGSEFCSGRFSKLIVVEIPEDATDWEFTEYDGIEGITYVQGGRLYHL